MTEKHRNAGNQIRVKTFRKFTLMALTCMIMLASCGPAGTGLRAGTNQADANLAAARVDYGPAIDRIILELRTDPAQALAEVAAGRADLILDPLTPAAFRNTGTADLEKLHLHPVPAESWSLLINPIPDAAPYTWTTASGQTSFNPLAIREVRYALNWLFDRQHLVNSILGGRGEAGFTPLPPGLPATVRYNAVPAGLGMSAAGDADRAIGDIASAMEAAAGLPENEGRLLKGADGFWRFDGRVVSIKFLIRADEPAGRLPLGRYLAAQIEQTGIRVQRLERDRSALALAYFSNPADLAFHIYTEAWAPRTGNSAWEPVIGQQYAPRHGSLPGGADPAWWQYRNPELDELAMKVTGGQYPDEEARLADSLKTVELGLREALRIYLAFQHDTYVSSKASFSSSLVQGSGTGHEGRILRTIKLQAEVDGSRILRGLHVQPGLDTAPGFWDPASPDGFAAGYAKTIAQLVSDAGEPDPAGTPGKPGQWHNDIGIGADDQLYGNLRAGTGSPPQGNRVHLPWDLVEVLEQLRQGSPEGTPQPAIDLVSPTSVDAILAKYRQLLEQQWVPSVLGGRVSPEQAAERYQASMAFIAQHGHALISNGPFVLSSLDKASGIAVLEAFPLYPYDSTYPIRVTQD